MGKNFKSLREKMSIESQVRSAKLAHKYRSDMALDELRIARQLTQEHLANLLNVKQASISKIERRTDWYVSTLESVIKAMGGSLEIFAVFPEGRVRIKKFQDIKDRDPKKQEVTNPVAY